jgi:RND family efflux transporter MFP subunit
MRGVKTAGFVLALLSAPFSVAGTVHAETLSVTQREVPDYRAVAGTLTTRDMGEVRARIPGTLVALRVREGDEVEKGQVLAVIADDKVALELQSRRAQAAALKAESDRAAADLERVRKVFDKGFYSKARLEQAAATSKAATEAWKAAAAAQAVAAETGQQGKLLSPAAGRVMRAPVPAGAVVMAGDVIVTVATNNAVIRFELPEREARGLKVGDMIRVSEDGFNGKAREAEVRVREIYPQVRDGRITVDLERGDLKQTFVGERIKARVVVGMRQSIVVPRDYVTTRFGVDYVSLVTRTGSLDIPVQTGQGLRTDSGQEGVEVLSGLRAGDKIVKPVRGLVQS